MDDRLLVEALRARDPGAPAAVYDAYAERLYAYSWMRLREQDAAQAAVSDALVVAEAQIERLRDPALFRPWLYAITRLECDRREPEQDRMPDLPVASHDQDDVDQRLLAWRAVLALSRRQRELLDLHVRHELAFDDIARVTRAPAKRVEEELELAGEDLETALVAEILAGQGPFGCGERGWLLRARRGELTPLLRERLVLHAGECEECAAFKPRTVSAARVFRVLPWAPLSDDMRKRVLDGFLDSERVGYRLFVATRVADYSADGFPIWPQRSAFARRVTRRRTFRSKMPAATEATPTVSGTPALAEVRPGVRAGRFAAAALATLMVLTGGTLVAYMALTGQVGRGVHALADGTGARPTVLPSRGLELNGRDERGLAGRDGATPVSATYLLGAAGSAVSPTASARTRQVQPGRVQNPKGANGGLLTPPEQRQAAVVPPPEEPGPAQAPPPSPPPVPVPSAPVPPSSQPPSDPPPSSSPPSPPVPAESEPSARPTTP
ncbi:RNA polymerase sigma factor [Actinomadura harenae]|uniref:Sigma-70 family RNA polymerase sigma factor n=1 Tax=Actinomadura harenae TaxID=2483351 RepID=A0A3M2M728_9ACTN|nr:sigma-70 family RNA polymerase sigma factor [Actinomadura harenae]RMI45332.1 sigma-70 family RNA polymerase sigma factor [Actinomadura harenae]